MSTLNQNPLNPPPSATSPVEPPQLDPVTGELVPSTPQPTPQPQQGSIGFWETIRQAARSNPAQFYNILAHLAAGAGPQHFAQIQQQQGEEQFQQQQLASQEEYRTQQLDLAQQRVDVEQQRYEQERIDRDTRAVESTLRWGEQQAPGSQEEWESMEGGPLTVDRVNDYFGFVGERKLIKENEEAVSTFVKQMQLRGDPTMEVPASLAKYLEENPREMERVSRAKVYATQRKAERQAAVDQRQQSHTRRMEKLDKDLKEADKEAGRIKLDDVQTRLYDEKKAEIADLRSQANKLNTQLNGMEGALVSALLTDFEGYDATREAIERLEDEIETKKNELNDWLNDQREAAGGSRIKVGGEGEGEGEPDPEGGDEDPLLESLRSARDKARKGAN